VRNREMDTTREDGEESTRCAARQNYVIYFIFSATELALPNVLSSTYSRSLALIFSEHFFFTSIIAC
jgi:hypothetical protein